MILQVDEPFEFWFRFELAHKELLEVMHHNFGPILIWASFQTIISIHLLLQFYEPQHTSNSNSGERVQAMLQLPKNHFITASVTQIFVPWR